MVEMKICGRCKHSLPLDDFHWKNKERGQLASYCKKCNIEYNKEHYRNNKEKYGTKARAYELANGGKRFLKYGLTDDDFSALISKYGGLCWICKQNDAKVVDHDHTCCSKEWTCGKCVRGILCNNCNAGIGLLKDSKEILSNALEYLSENNMSL